MGDSYEKRQRERRKQERRQEKALRKRERSDAPPGTPAPGPVWVEAVEGADGNMKSVRINTPGHPPAGPAAASAAGS